MALTKQNLFAVQQETCPNIILKHFNQKRLLTNFMIKTSYKHQTNTSKLHLIVNHYSCYRAQEIHLKYLKEYKDKKPFANTKVATKRTKSFSKGSPTSTIKFNVDEKNEKRKMNILKNKLNGRLFHLNE